MSYVAEAWVCPDCGGGSNAHKRGCKQDRRAMTQDYVLVPRGILRALVEFARNAGVAHHIIPDKYSETHCDDLLKAMEGYYEAGVKWKTLCEHHYFQADKIAEARGEMFAALSRLSSLRQATHI